MSDGWINAIQGDASLRERVSFVGAVDLDQARAQAAANRLGGDVAYGADMNDVIGQSEPDLVFDLVSPDARLKVVTQALMAGCHVLSEKPMALSLDDGRHLVGLARLTDRKHAIVQNRRFNDGVRRMKALVEAGAVGRLNAIHTDFFVGAHFGGFRDVMDNVLLVDMAIHTFDAARFVSGKEPLAVYCHEHNPESSWFRHGSVANAIFELSDEVVLTYRGSWSAEGANTSWNAHWRVVGSKGTILWDGENSLEAFLVQDGDGLLREARRIEIPPAPDATQTNGHASVIRSFLDAVDNGHQPETSGADNLKSLAMVFAAIESAKKATRVEIRV